MFESFQLAAVVDDLERVTQADLADLVEFRMDLARDPLDQLEDYGADVPLIATNRADWEGGKASGPDRVRELIEASRYSEVAAVDIELESVRTGEATELLDLISGQETLAIVSSHDFDRTPPESHLSETLIEASTHGDVAKLAVTAVDRADVLDLLSVTHDLSARDVRVATMCMGEAGRHSRVIAPLYGSRIGYAPIDPAEATAPGQYDLETFSELLAALR